MNPGRENLEQLEMSYRKSRRTVLGHFVFLLVCCIVAVALRRFFRFPPILAWTVFVVAGVVFARDIGNFFLLRYKVIRLRLDQESP
ncbi:MAG TPA: hypothetical protein VHO24_13215 [Opitutaceae bacterium]|nr:hypothetical protein [Opitutaceae bacterium]